MQSKVKVIENVDIDKLYEGICTLSNASREKFMSFIEKLDIDYVIVLWGIVGLHMKKS